MLHAQLKNPIRLFKALQSMDCNVFLLNLIVKTLGTAITFYAYLTIGVAPAPLVSTL